MSLLSVHNFLTPVFWSAPLPWNALQITCLKLGLVTHPSPVFIPSKAFDVGIYGGEKYRGLLVTAGVPEYHVTSLADVIKLFAITSCAKGHLYLWPWLFLFHVQDEDTVEDVCIQIIKQWTEWNRQSAAKRETNDGIWLYPQPHCNIDTIFFYQKLVSKLY